MHIYGLAVPYGTPSTGWPRVGFASGAFGAAVVGQHVQLRLDHGAIVLASQDDGSLQLADTARGLTFRAVLRDLDHMAIIRGAEHAGRRLGASVCWAARSVVLKDHWICRADLLEISVMLFDPPRFAETFVCVA